MEKNKGEKRMSRKSMEKTRKRSIVQLYFKQKAQINVGIKVYIFPYILFPSLRSISII